MSEILTFSVEDMVPERAAAFALQGIPVDVDVPDHVEALWGQAVELLTDLAEPRGLLAEVTQAEFAQVYAGDGLNEPETPVGDVFPQADHLALFAVTLGGRISQAITEHFASRDFALGYMLDSVASVAADRLAESAEARYCQTLTTTGRSSPSMGVLRYSPGYCGWHISGQRKLFEHLQPDRIGITLRASFLMDPLKSVSGVVIAGPRECHRVPTTYSFCSACQTYACRDRIQSLSDG
ncbi:MAG: hypothetical protein GY842_28445 [bacterium]|nr:hypothetical protein [bacterium]